MHNNLISAIVSVFGTLLWAYKDGFRLTPDGITLLTYSGGRVPCAPFHSRIALPLLFRILPGFRSTHLDGTNLQTGRHSVTIWCAVTLCSVSLSSYLMGYIWGPAASALFIFSPWARLMVSQFTTQTDQPALVFTMLAILAPPEYRFVFAVIGGLFHERVPVILSFITGDYWCALAFIPLYLSIRFFLPPGSPLPHEERIVSSPFKSAREIAKTVPIYYYAVTMAIMWLGIPYDYPRLMGIAACYGQCLIAWDRLRLFGWATLFLMQGTVAALYGLSHYAAVVILLPSFVAMHIAYEKVKL
jgi:hypothetical protein